MNFFSWLLSAEGLLRAFEITAVAAGVLAVAALIGKDITNRIVRERRAFEMIALQKDLAEAKERQSNAERELLEVKERTRPHALTNDELTKLRERVSNVAKDVRVEIVIAKHRFPTTEVSELYAKQLFKVLQESGHEVLLIEVDLSQIRSIGVAIFSLTGDGFPEANKLASVLYNGLLNTEATPVWKATDRNEAVVKVEIGLTP